MNKMQVEYLLMHKTDVIPDDDSLELYKNRCILCRMPTHTLHEIVPRSRSKKAFEWFNRVPICLACHLRIHQEGASNWEDRLRAERDRRLDEYWGVDANQ